MTRTIRAGLTYFAIVFAAGFVAGTVRTLLLAPRIGALGAVAVEVPAMLAVAWIACGWTLRHFPARRAAMGALAFALLIAGEFALALSFGIAPGAWLASLVTPPGMLGLAAQMAFGAFPLVRR